MAELTKRPVIGVTVGDPAGIGPEVVIKALCKPTLYNEVKPLVFADRSILEQTIKMLCADIDLHAVNKPHKGHYEVGCIDFIDVGSLSEPIAYGQISAEGGRAGYQYLDRAIDATLSGTVAGLSTAPLNKESLQAA
ncbi:MAG: 4-hydroxythreonine-4-phosphate dehydrogenase PdxA, partial [Gemmatimonadota bacterium]|nr:4-hydroxythreonine-4-phosphate dehydrogenase PdxA [Gemmatimonadota bacterium]